MNKICIKVFKTEKYQPEERGEKKISDRPTHDLAPKGQYNSLMA